MYDFSSAGPATGVAVASPPEPTGPTQSVGDELDWLRAASWREFEELVGHAYQLQGYDVLDTAHGADGGIDLILTRGSERIFVQCKHWNTRLVGVKVVRELYGVVAAHGATWGIVATSGRFTEEAEEFAHQARITLLDGAAVAQLIALGAASEPTVGPPLTQSSPVPAPRERNSQPSCPICAAAMTLRTARRGPQAGSRFWGCTRYPGCKGVRPAPAGLTSTKRPTRRILINLAGAAVSLTLIVGGIALGGRIFTSPIVPLPAPQAQAIAGSPAGFGEQTIDVAFDSTTNRLYTANYVSGDVTVADAKTLEPVGSIDVAGKPVAVASDGKHHRLYVADGGAKKIYVVDTGSHKTVATLTTTAKPSDLAIDVARQRLFVVSKSGNRLEVFNTATRTRVGNRTIPGGPRAITVDPTSHQLFIAASFVGAYSGFTLNRTEIVSVFSGAKGLAVDPRTDRLYVTSGTSVSEYNLVTHRLRPIDVGATAVGIAVNPTQRVAYLAMPGEDSVQSVSLK